MLPFLIENVSFGLEIKKMPKEQIQRRVDDFLKKKCTSTNSWIVSQSACPGA